MPRKNTRERIGVGPNHVYNRASRGRAVFRDDVDRDRFLEILGSRVGRAKFRSQKHRRAAEVLGAEVSAFCLMTTHFHLIVWQREEEAMRRLLQSVLTTYVREYNRRYNQSGALFAGPFRSRSLETQKELRWATAYVHANHPSGSGYRYSTHAAYLDDHHRPGWLATDSTLAAFGGRRGYARYMRDHATRAALNDRFF